MSTFNKLFIGSVLSAALFVLGHSGAWAIRSARSIDAAQAREIAPMLAMTAEASNGAMASLTKASADSCAGTTGSGTR